MNLNADEQTTPYQMTAQEKRNYRVAKWVCAIIGIGIARFFIGGAHQGPYTLHSAGGYEVTFPGSTQETDRALNTPGGEVALHYARCVDSDTDITDISAYAEAGSDRGVTEQSIIQGLAGQMGRRVNDHPIELDGWHGEEVVFEANGTHHLTSRVFIGKTRM